MLFSPVTKANIGTGPIRTGVDRTTLDPNDPNSRWFNPAAFTAAPALTLGTAAFYHNDFRQPAVFTESLAIVKRTVLFEAGENPVTLTYRADAFNLFNRTNFGGVVGTVGNANFGRPTAPSRALVSSRWVCVWSSNFLCSSCSNPPSAGGLEQICYRSNCDHLSPHSSRSSRVCRVDPLYLYGDHEGLCRRSQTELQRARPTERPGSGSKSPTTIHSCLRSKRTRVDPKSVYVAAGNGLIRIPKRGGPWKILTAEDVTELRD